MRRFQQFSWALMFVLILCQNAQADEINVIVSILPQKYFVQQIGMERVAVQVMVQPGASPHTYEPKPGQMTALSTARIFFAVGVPFEKMWLKRITAANPAMTVVHTDKGIPKLIMAEHRHEHDGHDAAHDDRTAPDPHIWLSPPLVKIQARTIAAALQAADPGHADFYQANFRRFSDEIDRLDAHLKETFAEKKGSRFMVFHPSWGYFAQAYGLEQIPIEIEGKAPKPAQLQALIESARRQDIRVIFVQPQFSTKSAELVAQAIGGHVLPADPLAEAWQANLYQLADTFKAALR